MRFKKAHHNEMVSLVNKLLTENAFAEKCELIEIKGDFYYHIKNPHKNYEAINIYFQEEIVTLCYIDLETKHIFWHNHLESWLTPCDISENANIIFENLAEIVKESIIFEARFENGKPCLSGFKPINKLDEIMAMYKNDSYCKGCGALEILSWTGKYDQLTR
ncbi:MAG: hypothetical protein FWE84_02245 [Firmicutes bacterium]|nr:hypothetical protein [Bacillota bacterium]